MKRRRYTVRWDAEKRLWIVWLDGEQLSECSTKAQAVDWARWIARNAWSEFGVLSQLTIFKKKGRTIQTEHTYGKDPEKTKG